MAILSNRPVPGGCSSNAPLFSPDVHLYVRDVYDHVLRLTEGMDTYRNLATGLLDIYISSVSDHMNEIMKVLTIFASIFIPLTFITGIYSRNFEHMPELHWRCGLSGALGRIPGGAGQPDSLLPEEEVAVIAPTGAMMHC